MVGEAQPQTVADELAPLGRHGSRLLGDLEVTSEQVVDRAGSGRAVKPETLAQCLEGSGVLGGPQVEVPAEEQGRIARPFGRCLGGAQNIGRRQFRPVVGRMQVGDAKGGTRPEHDASKRHRPPLRPALMDRQLPPLHHSFLPVRLLLVTGE